MYSPIGLYFLKICITRNDDFCTAINRQFNEFIVGRVSAYRDLSRCLKKLNRLRDFDEVAESAILTKIIVKFLFRDSRFEFVPCGLVLSNYEMRDRDG